VGFLTCRENDRSGLAGLLAGELAQVTLHAGEAGGKGVDQEDRVLYAQALLAQAERIKKQAGVMASQAGGPSGT
jgi:hypothetical protein